MEKSPSKGKTKSEPTYELEKELRDPKLRQEIVDKCHARIAHLKTTLQQGTDQHDYEQLSLLLQGYLALKRVIERAIQSTR